MGILIKKKEKGDKKSNEFDNYKNNVYELMHKVNSKQQEREEKIDKYGRQNEDIIRLGIEIRDALQDINIKLEEMDKVLSRQAKKPKVEIIFICLFLPFFFFFSHFSNFFFFFLCYFKIASPFFFC